MGTVVEISGKLGTKKRFSLEDASLILPIIYKLTATVHFEVKELVRQLDNLSKIETSTKSELIDRQNSKDSFSNVIQATQVMEERIAKAIDTWHTKVEKLGGEPKGLWLVDFDNGYGYYCWKFPETEIQYWHGYRDGFSGRKMIAKENSEI